MNTNDSLFYKDAEVPNIVKKEERGGVGANNL